MPLDSLYGTSVYREGSMIDLAEKEGGKKYRKLVETAYNALQRITKKSGFEYPSDVLVAYYGDRIIPADIRHNIKIDLVVVDDVEHFLPPKKEGFDGGADFYHVTSSKASESLSQGKDLLPPVFHGFDVLTHRGKALDMGQRFMECIGIPRSGAAFPESSLGSKDMFVFASPFGGVDGQAVKIEEAIARRSPRENDRILFNVLFDDSNKPTKLNLNLEKVINILIGGGKVDDPELLQYIENLQEAFFETLGLRFNWYDRLGQILRGEIRTKYIAHPSQIEIMLLHDIRHREYISGPDSSSDAVILRIDRKEATAGRGISILPIDDRDWRKIAILPCIKPGWVTVYSEDRSSAHGLPLSPLNELPREAFINGVTPDKVDLKNFNPSSALCGVKYGKRPNYIDNMVRLWKNPIREGLAVPLQSLPAGYDYDMTNLAYVLRGLLISGGVSEQYAKLIVQEHGFSGFGAHVDNILGPLCPYKCI